MRLEDEASAEQTKEGQAVERNHIVCTPRSWYLVNAYATIDVLRHPSTRALLCLISSDSKA